MPGCSRRSPSQPRWWSRSWCRTQAHRRPSTRRPPSARSSGGVGVRAIANPVEDLATDTRYVANFRQTIRGPIVLVGHSYGGAVITNAAAGLAGVKALVYVDAAAPAPGETNAQLGGARSVLITGSPATVYETVPRGARFPVDRHCREGQRHPPQRSRPLLGPEWHRKRVPRQPLPDERPAGPLRLSRVPGGVAVRRPALWRSCVPRRATRLRPVHHRRRGDPTSGRLTPACPLCGVAVRNLAGRAGAA